MGGSVAGAGSGCGGVGMSRGEEDSITRVAGGYGGEVGVDVD